jgi:hypothetical protein
LKTNRHRVDVDAGGLLKPLMRKAVDDESGKSK